MNRQDFYVTLSSNASTEYYPGNTLTHFWNRCPMPISLDDQDSWQVGLAEIYLPVNWVSLSPDDCVVRFDVWRHVPGVGDGKTLSQLQESITIDHGGLRDPRAFTKLFKEGLKGVKNSFIANAITLLNWL